MPLLTTARLRLRSVTRTDLDDIVQMDIDPEVYRFSELRRDVSVPERSQLRRTIRRELVSQSMQNFWAIEWLREPCFLGLIGFSPGKILTNVLAFRLMRSVWGRGIATEAATAVVDYGFSVLGFVLIEAFAHQHNARSHRVLSKINMKPNGIALLPQPAASSSIGSREASNIHVWADNRYVSFELDCRNYLSGLEMRSHRAAVTLSGP